MYKKVFSSQLKGVDGEVFYVESNSLKSNSALPNCVLVGNLNNNVKESLDRIKSACEQLNITLKDNDVRITTNIAPADKRKTSLSFDLAIFLSEFLSANEEFSKKTLNDDGREINIGAIGYVNNDGSIEGVNGSYAMCQALKNADVNVCFVSYSDYLKVKNLENDNFRFVVCSNIKEMINCVENGVVRDVYKNHKSYYNESIFNKELKLLLNRREIKEENKDVLDISDLNIYYRDEIFKVIAASYMASINVNLDGFSGYGQSMYARRINTFLPDLSFEDKEKLFKIYDSVGQLDYLSPDYVINKVSVPYRCPHHSCTLVSLYGGGGIGSTYAGECSLSYKGCLHLDDVQLFPKYYLESLKDCIEDKNIRISRLNDCIDYPFDSFIVSSIDREKYESPFLQQKYDKRIENEILPLVSNNLNINVNIKLEGLHNGPCKNSLLDSSTLKCMLITGIEQFKKNKHDKIKNGADRLCFALASLHGRNYVNQDDINLVDKYYIGKDRSRSEYLSITNEDNKSVEELRDKYRKLEEIDDKEEKIIKKKEKSKGK